jgi:hypothetical protein
MVYFYLFLKNHVVLKFVPSYGFLRLCAATWMDGPDHPIPNHYSFISHKFKIQAESFVVIMKPITCLKIKGLVVVVVVIMKPIHHKDPPRNIFQFPEQSTEIINQPSGRKLASKYTGQIAVAFFVSIRAITNSGLRK